MKSIIYMQLPHVIAVCLFAWIFIRNIRSQLDEIIK